MSLQQEGLLSAPQDQIQAELFNGQRLSAIQRIAGRIALTFALTAGGSMAAGVGEAMLDSSKPAYAATEFSNDYPDGDAAAYNTATYDWWKDEDADGNPDVTATVGDDDETMSLRGYNYRNCTDGVAYWVKKYTNVDVRGWGNAKDWDIKAPADKVIAGTTMNNIEPGDIAQSDDGGGGYGHVGFVTAVVKDANGNATSFTTAELNKGGDGNFTSNTYNTRNAAGKFNRGGGYDWDNFIDVNGTGKGLNNENWPDTGPPPPDPLALSFVRLNHSSGNVEVISYSEASNYQTATENTFSGYPAVPQDGNVIPLFQKDGDLSFVRLNDASGHVQVVTYSEASGYHTMIQNVLTGYPSVSGDGSVIPVYQYDGDLSFIRLNHASGHVEVVAYSEASNFQTMTESTLTAYPAVETNGAVVPLYWLNDDLVLLRMNHYSGHVELISLSKSSNYQNVVNNSLVAYPAVAAPGVAPDGSVVPMFQPQDGDLSFVKLNHYSGHPEVITYSVGSNFQTMNDYDLSSYPAVQPHTGVIARYSN